MEKSEIKAKILELTRQKDAIILAHYYQDGDIQEVADFVGDSLALAQKQFDQKIAVMAGVQFMAETLKILHPEKKILVTELSIGCSLADGCKAREFEAFVKKYPGYKVLTYVNTSADIKALTDVVVTSSNALKIADSFPKVQKLIFGPDKNLGAYINRKTGRNMVLWDGCCHVHDRFSVEKIKELKTVYPEAEVLCHPECREEVDNLADYVGSTSGILKYVKNSQKKQFIIITEPGILYQMRKENQGKELISIKNECEYMKINTLEKILYCLENEKEEVVVDEEIAKKAKKSIDEMLRLSI